VEHWGVLPRDTGPRLLGIRRLGLLAMGQTIEEVPADPVPGVDPGRWNRTGLKGTPPGSGAPTRHGCVFIAAHLMNEISF